MSSSTLSSYVYVESTIQKLFFYFLINAIAYLRTGFIFFGIFFKFLIKSFQIIGEEKHNELCKIYYEERKRKKKKTTINNFSLSMSDGSNPGFGARSKNSTIIFYFFYLSTVEHSLLEKFY